MSFKSFSRYSAVFAVAATSAAMAGIVSVWLLHAVQDAVVSSESGPVWLRPLIMALAGIALGFAWWWIRLKPVATLTKALNTEHARFSFPRVGLDAALQVITVGVGGSVGREVAPRQFAASLTNIVAGTLVWKERQTVLACSAGAALAAVYNTPWAGAIYISTVLLRRFDPLAICLGLATSWVAVLANRALHGTQPYYDYPAVLTNQQIWFWVPPAIVLGALFGRAFKLLQSTCVRGVKNKYLPWSIGTALGATGIAAIWVPAIEGNGVLVFTEGFSGQLALSSFILLIVLKPLFTVLTLSSGALGGVLTPALALGGALGGAAALVSNNPQELALFMIVGASAVLATTENSWAFACIFVLELVGAPPLQWAPVLVAGIGAMYLNRAVGRLFESPKT